MIILHTMGGMGNQMFMYAAGLQAATRLNTTLRLGAWENYSNTGRPYCLYCFPAITERDASFLEVWRIYPFAAIRYVPLARIPKIFASSYMRLPFKLYNRLVQKLALRLLFLEQLYKYKKPYHPIQSCVYTTEFEHIPDNTYMMGYWESEKFFAGISDMVRRKFRFAPECFNKELAKKIRECNSVAIHVRRGDKVNNSGIKPTSNGYIRSAIEKISALTHNPVFFVFSDDIKWCRENLQKIYDAEYNFVEGQTPPQDMALMTICRHVIIGPSTFSWWGAWLNENPNKIIIAPDINLWYADPTGREDLLPERWIKIS